MNVDMLTNISIFSGAGGLDLGAKLVGGIRTVCYVEFDRYAQGVLMSRMRDKTLDQGPIWDDVRTFSGVPWRDKVDIISGGFPCQDVSVAGKGEGIKKGNRSGLWFEYARIIREVRPRFVLVENVSALLVRGIDSVLGELAEAGYNAEWFSLRASDVGALHRRERIWIVAHAQRESGEKRRDDSPNAGEGGLRRDHKRRGRGDDCREPNAFPDEKLADPERAGQSRREREERPGRTKSDGYGQKMADANSKSGQQNGSPADPKRSERDSRGYAEWCRRSCGPKIDWWSFEPDVGRVADGVASRVDRLRCLGNGVVPQQSVPAWNRIKELSKMQCEK